MIPRPYQVTIERHLAHKDEVRSTMAGVRATFVRDHQALGGQGDRFSCSDDTGSEQVLLTPRGFVHEFHDARSQDHTLTEVQLPGRLRSGGGVQVTRSADGGYSGKQLGAHGGPIPALSRYGCLMSAFRLSPEAARTAFHELESKFDAKG